MADYTEDYLLDKKVRIFQPVDGYRAAIDAVILSSMVHKVKSGDKILDLGSGTGAISLCLAHRFPAAEITGLEIQPQLVELSTMSAAANGFDKLRFENCDIRKPPVKLFNGFNHLVTNPPYAADDMPSPNAGKALAHNFQDFDLEKWLLTALKFLRPLGWIYIINRTAAIDEILSVLHGRAGAITVLPLFSKAGQEAKRVIVCARKGDKSPSRILPGLTVHDADGQYTSEAQLLLREGKGFFDSL